MTTPTPRFDNVFCSECGRDFGPGDNGFSHCRNHAGVKETPLTNHQDSCTGPDYEGGYKAIVDLSRQLERDLAARDAELAEWKRKAEEAARAIDLARRAMSGEGVEDQGQAWDKCLRILDAAIAAKGAA